MKTLGASYLRFFMCRHRDKERPVWCSREIAPTRQENGFPENQKRVSSGCSLAVSSRQKRIHPVSAASSSFSSSSSSQTNVASEEIQTICSDQPKTAHVRFKLNKECAFGQQFLIVGDDPIIGLWDPSDGVPLTWSDGHVWIAEMDIPSGKIVKYKFILKGITGDISWQPGPDRILETWDTEKTITVSEDWDNPELQTIVEEELVADQNQECLVNSDLSMVAENLNQPIVAENLNQPIVSDEGTDVIKEIANANGHTNNAVKPSEPPMVSENISVEFGEKDFSYQRNEEMISGSNLLSSNDETSLVFDEHEGVPVLVPGLVPMPHEEVEASEQNQMQSNITTIECDEIEDSTTSESKEEHVSASLHSTETNEMKIDEKRTSYGTEQIENNILETDMQWGRRTIQKFLANFGFQ